jgi:carbamoylphosphate synthase large subunit
MFEYSGTQATFSRCTCIEPLVPEAVARVINGKRPDALLPANLLKAGRDGHLEQKADWVRGLLDR